MLLIVPAVSGEREVVHEVERPAEAIGEVDQPAAVDPCSADLDLASLSSELRVVVGQLIRRLRAQYAFGWSHAAVLSRLYRDGPQFIGELAAAERVRPQSMSQTLADLEAEGLIERGPDADDGRRTRIAITARGRSALDADRAARDGWLAEQISGFTAAEQAALHDSLALLRRLAETD
jgi:DNA-binding MarR family transcriptional regulator